MANAIKFGIVGLGKMGRIRANTIRKNKNAILVSGHDISYNDFGFNDLKLLNSYQDVINSDIDAIFVCTPNRFIPYIAEAALDAGKHVFCEKPPGRNLKDIERIMDAEKRNPDLVLKIGFNHRYHYGVMEAKKIVDSGKYGKILWLRGIYGKAEGSGNPNEWRNDPELSGGGILLDQGIHMLDLFRYFCGEFSEIKSMCTTAFWEIPVEDNAFALLRNDHGIIAMLHSSYTQWKHRFTLDIYLDDGYMTIDGMPSSTRSYRDEWIIQGQKNTGYAIGNPSEIATFCNTDPSWDLELSEFIQCIQNNTPVINGTSKDAFETMKLVFGIYENDSSFQLGKKQSF